MQEMCLAGADLCPYRGGEGRREREARREGEGKGEGWKARDEEGAAE